MCKNALSGQILLLAEVTILYSLCEYFFGKFRDKFIFSESLREYFATHNMPHCENLNVIRKQEIWRSAQNRPQSVTQRLSLPLPLQ